MKLIPLVECVWPARSVFAELGTSCYALLLRCFDMQCKAYQNTLRRNIIMDPWSRFPLWTSSSNVNGKKATRRIISVCCPQKYNTSYLSPSLTKTHLFGLTQTEKRWEEWATREMNTLQKRYLYFGERLRARVDMKGSTWPLDLALPAMLLNLADDLSECDDHAKTPPFLLQWQ